MLYENDNESPTLTNEVHALIDNGLDFLNKARREFESGQHKHSIVNFWTAVEILLKVPLVHEHWTLVCTGKKISRKNYLAGNFQSVTYDETCDRLRDILEKNLPTETTKIFDKVRKHRNRVVHFYHNAFSETELQNILAEQADAWFSLNRLMRDDWPSLFGHSLNQKLALDETHLLQNNEFYATAKFKYIKPQLDQLVAQGLAVSDCPHCKQIATVEYVSNENSTHPLYELRCHVCLREVDKYIEANCPECTTAQRIYPDDQDFTCQKCHHSLTKYSLLDEGTGRAKDSLYSPLPASCSDCGGYESICEYDGGYFCTQCFTLHESLEPCGYCNHYSNDVGEFSIINGCNFCDGNTKLLDG